ncbi:MAG: hypothetical protein IKW33_00085 [Clostridia bacterium]|nr:hypothetical protein [Clostridia bacterium]
MWPFKSKYQKLKREDVVDSICQLEKQEADIEQGIIEKTKQIEDLMRKGKAEKNRDMQLFLAKKITMLKEEKEADIKRGMYLLYNIKLAKRLKDAIDDNQFIANTGKISMRNLLADQKGLAKFLNKALNTKVKDEQILTSADEIFNEIQDSYEANDNIYGVQKNDDALLAMFETEKGLDEDLDIEQSQFDEEKEADSSAN